MFSKINQLKNEQKIFLIAAIIGLIVVIYYVLSGQGSYNQNFRELKNSDPNVQEVSAQDGPNGEKDLAVKCQDGSSYDVYYPPGETDYAALAASKCQP